MRSIVLFALALLMLAGLAAQYAVRYDPLHKPVATALAATTSAPRIATDRGRSVTVRKDQRGHYQVNAAINGRQLRLMVDTGASVVALNTSEAERLGIYPAARDFRTDVQTANGIVRAASTLLPSVEIGGITVRNVSALIVPDEALGENLLGLSFLSRLRRYEFAEGRLVLEE
ncbi:MAG: aspartyl protease family protein [Variibacter sp.]|jgi:aspartyl protease family protein|nr:aspartyl protease family protein [Variibacter sp.]